MTPRATRFVGLDPRKAKRTAIETALSGLGTLKFLRTPPVALANYPETTKRVTAAFDAATKKPTNGLLATAKKTLLRLQYNGSRAFFAKRPDAVAVAWNGLNGTRRVFMDGAADAGARRLYFELCPFKGRITVDPCGVNYANSLPRIATPYLSWAAVEATSTSWRDIGSEITARAPSHPKTMNADTKPLTDPFIFVPLQVPGDSQLRLFGGSFPTVETTLKAVATAASHLPDGWHLRIKEHPTSPIRFDGLIGELAHSKLVLDNATDTFAQVAAARAVVTVNSSVGLEAMFFDKPVAALGQCFWAIPGIAAHAPSLAALIDLMKDPAKITFDPASRSAFLAFLIDQYYPDLTRLGPDGNLDKAEANKISERLAGPDRHGFWHSVAGALQ